MGKMQKKIELDETQKELILTNLDNDGKLSCLKAFKVSRLIGLKPIDMSDACKGVGVKITNCELGVFGKIKFQDPETAIYSKIKQNFTQDRDVSCKTLWFIAQESSLRRVGNTVKNSDIEVTHCQLGCFRERKGKREIKN
ncbi:ModE family transcriptional regulator [Halarcobacter sp.]|uniref:ModE family transcriptional regulator n=1 Tax=Halarcobacter sp. TaxID=2321133 RepID=UPI002AA60F5E|nr:ModE family transcriptional regulator [Halarcobacter sp.]|eukprot:Anaeramoba_ignava/a621690_6.p1 GENE.a621690_6~~a621690_6.p1  ORF type:complete len:140 (+),score=19.58 a621690_6:150-569(+)